MRSLARCLVVLSVLVVTFGGTLGGAVLGVSGGAAWGQTTPLPLRKGTKYRVKVDSSPQQAAIYVDGKQFGIQGYTPSTLRLPKGPYKIILELPGFKPREQAVEVKRAQAFVFTLERAARPAVVELRSAPGDSATGAQLSVDGVAAGTVPSRSELPAGRHVIEVKKQGWKDFRDTVDVQEGETRTMVVDLQAELKKGTLLVSSDAAGAEVYVDGTRRDTVPAVVADLVEGEHTVEVRKDPLPPFRQVVKVLGNQQVKVDARFAEKMAGTVRVVSSTPEADVFVDGELKGKANTNIEGLRAGQHILELKAKGFQAQSMEVQIVAGESRVVKMELAVGAAADQAPEGVARLRVVTAVPDAEVFLDGALVGKAPIDRKDVAAGKHYVVVRKQGFAEWKREVDIAVGQTISLTAELSASAILKILANVAGADVFIDSVLVGKTPLTLPNVAAGDHLVEVKKSGYHDAKQPLRVEGGEQKVLSAELASIQTGPTAADLSRRARGASSFSAVTLDPARFTFDLAVGFLPFAQARLTVGVLRKGMLGLDAGIGLKTNGYLTEGGAHAKFQFLKAGPVAIGTQVYLGGGGGPGGRNNFTFEVGLPISLLFGEIVRFTANPYLSLTSDRLCPEQARPGEEADGCTRFPPNPRKTTNDNRFGDENGQDPRQRFVQARFMLQAALEVAVHQVATLFFIFEGAPTGQRAAYTGRETGYAPVFKWYNDPQVYGRIGVTFKF